MILAIIKMRGEGFMKKRIALLLGMVLTVSALAGCTNKTAEEFMKEQSEKQNAVAEESKGETDTAPTEGGVKTGLALVTKVGSSADAAADAEGIAQTDVMIAAVTVDAEGKIAACAIEQSAVNFGTDGKLTTDVAAEVQSKNELGTNYGMNKASSIGKDVDWKGLA